MDVAMLIATAAKRSLDEHPLAIGVRFSPISISAEDLDRVPAEVQRLVGPSTYVAASAPGASRRCGERVFVSGDQEAAEQATAWRNVVRVPRGEHLIYVSVEEHGKASGLQDCLLAVSEADLAETLLAWMDSSTSGLPKGLAEGLREAGLHESRSLAALTSFAQAAGAGAPKAKGWAAVAKHLPLIGLATDSGLKAEDAAERLRANAKLITAALTGESRRRATTGPTAEIEEQLRGDLRDAPATSRARVLTGIDLGAVKTKALGPKAKKPQAKKNIRAAAAPPKPSVSGSTKGKAADAKAGNRSGGKADLEAAEPSAGPDASKGSDLASTNDNPEHKASKLHAPILPEGMAALLEDLHRGPGSPVRLTISRDARACLGSLPRAAAREQLGSPRLQEVLGGAFSRWSVARRTVLTTVGELVRKPEEAGALLVGGLPKLAASGGVAPALRRMLEVSVELYRSAMDHDMETQLEVLRLDTIEIHDQGGVALRLLGPLHLLWLGQALARCERLATGEGLAGTAKRLVSRVATGAPPAPQMFSEGGRDELHLARPEAGLIVYERAPDVAVGRPVAELADALVRRYIELCPHACLRLRIALFGGDEAAFLDGLAAAVAAIPELKQVEVLCSWPPRIERHSPAAAAFEAGRMRIDALPTTSEHLAQLNPHLTVLFRNDGGKPEDEEPSAPTVASFAPAGAGASTFEIRPHSLRVWTPLEGSGALAFEELHAAVRGRKALGAFIAEHAALSLKSVVPPQGGPLVTWHAVVAPSVGRKPPLGYHLIAHDRVEEAQCAVISRELRPLTRALQGALRQLGVNESRPNVLKTLGAKLSSSTSAALLSLRRGSELQLLAGVLSLELTRRAGAEALLVTVDAAHLAALAGGGREDYDEQLFMLSVWARDGALAVTIGFASSNAGIDIDLSKPSPGGKVGELAVALADLWRLAANGSGAVGTAARELLSWIIWPVLAAEEGGPAGIQEALRAWRFREEVPGRLFLLPPELTSSLPRGKKTSASVLTLEPALLNKLLLT